MRLTRIRRDELGLIAVLAIFRALELTRSSEVRRRSARLITEGYHAVSRARRRAIDAQLRATFGARYSDAERERIVKQTSLKFWDDALLLCRLPLRDELRAARLEGSEHIRVALDRGRGAILLENAFFGYRNASKRILHAQGWTAHQTHDREHIGGFGSWSETSFASRVLRPFFEARERQFCASIIHLSDTDSFAFTRQLADRLGANELVFIAADGRVGQKRVEVRFLDRPLKFAPGAISLARLTGAPVLPVFCIREPEPESEGGMWRAIVEPPLQVDDGSRGVQAAMAGFARLLDSYVRRHPGQYHGWHKLDPYPDPRVSR
jgi:lauroyl/myristoyl acyltransferase